MVAQIDTGLNGYINQYMCSYYCQCPVTASQFWEGISEADFNYVKRTKVQGISDTDQNGNRRIFFNNVNTVSKFSDCVPLLDKATPVDESQQYLAAMQIATYFESKYFCSGVC